MDGGERVERLWDFPDYRCHRRWRHGGRAGFEVAFIRVGPLNDERGRWFVDVAGPDAGTTAWPDEQAALAAVQELMGRREGEWEQVECYPTHGWQDGERDR